MSFPDEQKALKRLKTYENIVILPAGKGRVTVVIDKIDYNDKMDSLVNDKQTYEVLKRDPTPALQRKLNNKLLTLKKTDKIDFRRYNRLRCSVPQPPKLYRLPKLHKPNIPMRPKVSFCGSPTFQLSKYLTNVLKPLTDESRHKLQSTGRWSSHTGKCFQFDMHTTPGEAPLPYPVIYIFDRSRRVPIVLSLLAG